MTDADHWTWRWIDCPLCGEQGGRFVGYRGGFAHRDRRGSSSAIMRCGSCGLMYANPMPFPRDHSHYDKAPTYFGQVDTDAKVRAYAALLARVTQLRGSAGRMIDIGCGRGESLVAARQSGWDAIGVEPSARFVEAGRRELRVEIDHGQIDERRYAPHSFDLALLSGVLEHVYAPMRLLKLARRHLTDGGILYVDVPNEASVALRVVRLAHRLRGRQWTANLSPTFPPFHVVGFSPPTLRVAFSRAGFAACELHPYRLSFAGHPSMVGRSSLWTLELLCAPFGGSSGTWAFAFTDPQPHRSSGKRQRSSRRWRPGYNGLARPPGRPAPPKAATRDLRPDG